MDIITTKNDIETLDDIKTFVDAFYGAVRQDALLAPIFNDKIEDRWAVHLEKMYRFWQTVLLDEHTYYGSPFMPHAKLPVSKAHFEKWVLLFCQTIDGLFVGEKAERAKWQGKRMAEMFYIKIEYYKNNSTIPLV